MSLEERIELDETASAPITPEDDLAALERRLGLSEVTDAEADRLKASPQPRPTRSQLVRLAYEIHKARMRRERLFKKELFGEPAWDMLLCLYALPARGEVLTVSSLSTAANVPSATGIRWQRILLREGLIKRGRYTLDARLHLVALSPRGRLLMDEYLTRLFHCRHYSGD